MRARAGVVGHVLDMYGDIPSTVAIGSGPGTYSSRAWQTFAKADSTSRTNVVGGYATSLTGGQVYSTDVSEKYVAPQIEKGPDRAGLSSRSRIRSRATRRSWPRSGCSVLALIVGVYVGALARLWRMARRFAAAAALGRPLPALVIATFVAFLTILQMALLENWFEVTRSLSSFGSMFAVCCKELDAREAP